MEIFSLIFHYIGLLFRNREIIEAPKAKTRKQAKILSPEEVSHKARDTAKVRWKKYLDALCVRAFDIISKYIIEIKLKNKSFLASWP
jgi:hypothetical protein